MEDNLKILKVEQAGLSRATLEISSDFSYNSPLICSYLPHQLGSLSLKLAVARAAHSMPLEISHLVSDWALILFFLTDFFLVRLPLEVVFISSLILAWSPELKFKI